MHEIDQASLEKWANEWFDDHDLGPFELIDDDPLIELNGIYYKSHCKKCGKAISIRIDCTPFRIIGDHCTSQQEDENQNKIALEVNAKMQGNDWSSLENLDSADVRRIQHGVEELFKSKDIDIVQYLEKVDESQVEAILNALTALYLKKISGVQFRADKFRKKFGTPKQWRGCDVFINAKKLGESEELSIIKAVVVIPNTPIRIFYSYVDGKKDEISFHGLAYAKSKDIHRAIALIAPLKKEIATGNQGMGRPSTGKYEPYARRAIDGEPLHRLISEAADQLEIDDLETVRRGINRAKKRRLGLKNLTS